MQKQISFGGWWGGASDTSGNFHVAGSNGMIKFDTSGNISWQKTFTNFVARNLALDSSGNIYLVGYHNASTNNRAVIIKYNSSGTLQWQRQIYQTGIDNQIDSVRIDPVSGAVVVGIAGKDNNNYGSWFTAKLPVDGSKTGTISASGFPNLTYEASSLTEGTMTATLTTPTQTVSNGTLSFSAAGLPDNSLGLSATTTNI